MAYKPRSRAEMDRKNERAREQRNDPAVRARYNEVHREWVARQKAKGPEFQARRNDCRRKQREDPLVRARHNEESRKRYADRITNDPEFRPRETERLRTLRYKVTTAECTLLYEYQGRACAICQRPLARKHLDHDHLCHPGGQACRDCVRGYVCSGCNTSTLRIVDGWREVFGDMWGDWWPKLIIQYPDRAAAIRYVNDPPFQRLRRMVEGGQ